MNHYAVEKPSVTAQYGVKPAASAAAKMAAKQEEFVAPDVKDGSIVLHAPSVYYPIVCAGLSDEQIRVMEEENAPPHGWENMAYEDFLIERRKLMAAKIKAAFEILKKAAT